MKIQEIMKILNRKTVLPVILKLMDKNILTIHEEINEVYKPKLIRYIKLHSQYNNNDGLAELIETLKKSEKQKSIVLQYFQLSATEKKPISVKNLIEKSNCTSTQIKILIDKEIFEEYFVQVDRVDNSQKNSPKELILSNAQQVAFEQLKESFITKNVCLLHGVTSSGKTEIYIKLIESYLTNDKQILFLLPEIALTTQLVSRLSLYFGDKIAVFHSKYNNNERVEVWKQVLQNLPKARIVIGARSALLLPYANLGLIIIDEEHEQTFKQVDPAPRYHARDAAIVLANLHKAKVLLGSATPSLETYYNTKTSKFGLVTVTERFGNVKMPKIELVDLKIK